MDIKCNLFGVPEIYKNGSKVEFSYSKIYAFIYYILIEKTVSRSEMAGLLWPEDTEKTAKKNLRNVLYHAKKNIDKNFILSPNNSILQLNEELDIFVDVLKYLTDPKKNSYLYQGDFLKGFTVKDSEEYEHWIHNKRSIYLDSFYKNLQKKVKESMDREIFSDVETDLQNLISIDNLDEENYKLLMDFYLRTNRLNKVIESYSDLNMRLKEELGVDPKEDIKSLYEKGLERLSRDKRKKKDKSFYYFGREAEIARLHSLVGEYKKNSKINTVYVEGELGVGKSALIERVYDDYKNDFQIFNIHCYQSEEGKILKPLEILIGKLINSNTCSIEEFSQLNKLIENIHSIQINYRSMSYIDYAIERLEDTFVEVFNKTNKDYRIFHFEDIHWMDEYTMKILSKIIVYANKYALFFLTARSSSKPAFSDLIFVLKKYKKLETIELKALSWENSEKYIRKAMAEVEDKNLYRKIFEESEGLPLFMAEFIKQAKRNEEIGRLSLEIERSIKARFTYLTEDEIDVLEMLSFFKSGFPAELIAILFKKDTISIVKLLDKMVKRNILEEYVEDDNISFKFAHRKIKEYFYQQSTKTKRKHFHQMIGKTLEGSGKVYKNKLKYFQELSYHFKEAKDDLKELKYNIEILNHYLDFSHELFPVLDILDENIDSTIYMTREAIEKMFSDLKTQLDNVERSGIGNIDRLKMKFYHMRGRYLIREGKYEEGLEDIKFIIEKGKLLDNIDYVLNGYKQMIFYNIQLNNPKEMINYIEEALKLAVRCNYHKEIGMLLRLKGLYNIMRGNYDLGESLLRDSINNFNITDAIATEYSINIAAAHNYIGEIRLATKKYEEAKKEFNKAIELTKYKSAPSSLSVFYINMGKTYFALDDIESSKKYFNLALELYEKFDSYWKMPVLNAYMALIELYEENYDKSRSFLTMAKKYSRTMKDPRSLGTVYFAEYLIARLLENKDIKNIYKDLIVEEPNYYRLEAIKYLDEYRDVFEMETLGAKNEAWRISKNI